MSRIGNKTITIPAGVEVTVAAGNEVTVKGPKGTLTRQFNENMQIDVSGNKLTLNVGFSHPVEFEVEEGLKVECPSATEIKVSGIDKQRVGEFAAVVRATKKPEPYKGKGIRYKGEHVRRKEGKTAGKK